MPDGEKQYVLTVEWCKNGVRGVFCTEDLGAFIKEGTPHTKDEMLEILDMFALVLDPKSVPLSSISQPTRWRPLGEYSDKYGIAF